MRIVVAQAHFRSLGAKRRLVNELRNIKCAKMRDVRFENRLTILTIISFSLIFAFVPSPVIFKHVHLHGNFAD